MSVSADTGGATLCCDDCGLSFNEPDIDAMMTRAQAEHWKVFNDPDHGIQHFCMTCGAQPEHELAARMRASVAMTIEDRGAGDSTGLLDDLVVSAAQARGDRIVPDAGVVEKRVEEDGAFSFGFDLGDDD